MDFQYLLIFVYSIYIYILIYILPMKPVAVACNMFTITQNVHLFAHVYIHMFAVHSTRNLMAGMVYFDFGFIGSSFACFVALRQTIGAKWQLCACHTLLLCSQLGEYVCVCAAWQVAVARCVSSRM